MLTARLSPPPPILHAPLRWKMSSPLAVVLLHLQSRLSSSTDRHQAPTPNSQRPVIWFFIFDLIFFCFFFLLPFPLTPFDRQKWGTAGLGGDDVYPFAFVERVNVKLAILPFGGGGFIARIGGDHHWCSLAGPDRLAHAQPQSQLPWLVYAASRTLQDFANESNQ